MVDPAHHPDVTYVLAGEGDVPKHSAADGGGLVGTHSVAFELMLSERTMGL
jgi:hypothetical protein